MSNIAVTRGPELEERLERAQAEADLLRAVKALRDRRSKLAREIAELDHQLSKFDDPLRIVLLDRPPSPAVRPFLMRRQAE